MKWQCVELGRRYLLVNYGVVFDSIPMAYDIFDLKTVLRVKDNKELGFYAQVNGQSKIPPRRGSLLIWKPQGYFKTTGHVAVISNVGQNFLDIVEQNVDDEVWPTGTDYSRRLRTSTDQSGAFRIHCTFLDTRILGWMTHTNGKETDDGNDDEIAEDLKEIGKSPVTNGKMTNGGNNHGGLGGKRPSSSMSSSSSSSSSSAGLNKQLMEDDGGGEEGGGSSEEVKEDDQNQKDNRCAPFFGKRGSKSK